MNMNTKHITKISIFATFQQPTSTIDFFVLESLYSKFSSLFSKAIIDTVYIILLPNVKAKRKKST